MVNTTTSNPWCNTNVIPTHFDLFDKAASNCVDFVYVGTHATVINVGVKPAVAAGVGLPQDLRLLQCKTEHSHSKETSAVCASSYPTPPAIPPTDPLMSEKPAFFPEESEAARICPGNTNPPFPPQKTPHPSPWSPKRKPESKGERGRNCAMEKMGRGCKQMNCAWRRKVLLKSFPCHIWACSHKQEGKGERDTGCDNRWSNVVAQFHLFQPMSE